VPVPIRAPDLADPLLDAKMTDEAAAQAEAKGGRRADGVVELNRAAS
jgi:hypothetical protein